MSFPEAVASPAPPPPRVPGPGSIPMQALAPAWHTLLLAGLFLAESYFSFRHADVSRYSQHHVQRYLSTIGMEWSFVALMWFGLWLRKTPMRQLLGQRRIGWRNLLQDFGIAALFWIMVLPVLGLLGGLLQLVHAENAKTRILALAPSTLTEAALWLLLSLTAGIAEELLFRGYFQLQFAWFSKRMWVGALASALLFGAMHLYEGVSGALVITVFGALFSFLAVRRNALRAGMIAHAWHDTFTGAVMAFLKLSRLI